MTDTPPIWTREPVASPCIKICVIHPVERICTGCLRTMEEITGWVEMSQTEREYVMATLPERAPLLKRRRGGRAGRHGI